MKPRVFFSAVLAAAERHGLDDNAEHEVGDLQQFARALWDALTPAARARIMTDDTWTEFLANWGPQ